MFFFKYLWQSGGKLRNSSRMNVCIHLHFSLVDSYTMIERLALSLLLCLWQLFDLVFGHSAKILIQIASLHVFFFTSMKI